MVAGTGSFARDGPKVSVVRDAAIRITLFWRNAVFFCAGLSLSSIRDFGHHFSQDQDPFAQVVLADLPNGYVQDRCVDSRDAAAVGDQRRTIWAMARKIRKGWQIEIPITGSQVWSRLTNPSSVPVRLASQVAELEERAWSLWLSRLG
jgi:hypothetical protein